MKKQIIPSIIAKTQKELENRIKKVPSKVYQLDIMDGKFVKNKSLMFLLKLPKGKKYEADLMMNGHNAMNWIRKNKNKMDLIIISYEARNFKPLFGHLKKQKIKRGIAINPKTPIKKIIPYLKDIDLVLVRTVNPGKYGSKFLPETLKKVRELRKLSKKIDIEVDGGINDKTISRASKAGANRFVIGSYLQNSEDVKKDLGKLKKRLN